MRIDQSRPRREPPVGLPRASVRALVVDRHPLTRIGLGVVIHRQPWIAKCLLAADVEEGALLVRRHRPDVAVVDVGDSGPVVDGQLAPLREARPTMAIVLSNLSAPLQPQQPTVVDRLRLITAEQSVEEIIATIRAAVLGEGGPITFAGAPAELGLSARERQVLALLSTGATNREIAAVLHVGPETVKKHARSLYRKLGARNRTEAARRASELSAA